MPPIPQHCPQRRASCLLGGTCKYEDMPMPACVQTQTHEQVVLWLPTSCAGSRGRRDVPLPSAWVLTRMERAWGAPALPRTLFLQHFPGYFFLMSAVAVSYCLPPLRAPGTCTHTRAHSPEKTNDFAPRRRSPLVSQTAPWSRNVFYTFITALRFPPLAPGTVLAQRKGCSLSPILYGSPLAKPGWINGP